MPTTANIQKPTTIPAVAYQLTQMLAVQLKLDKGAVYTVYKQMLKVISDDNRSEDPRWNFDDYIEMLKICTIDDALKTSLYYFQPKKTKAKVAPKLKVNAATKRLDTLEADMDTIKTTLSSLLTAQSELLKALAK